MTTAATRLWSAAAVVAALWAAAGGASAQLPRPGGSRDAATAARVGGPAVPAVRIDAVVTDRQGRAVSNLRASDFELRVNGSPQQLDAVEVRRATNPATDGAAPGSAAGARVFAFVLDEFHVSEGAASARVREALTRFIDEQLRPDDLVIAIKPLDQVTGLRFTSDHASLRTAVASFAGRKGDATPRSRFEEEFIGRAPATVAAARAQIVTVALTEIAMQLGELAADRAAIVLVSEGFPRTASTSRRAPRVQDLQGVLRAASRFHFSIYAFNPGDTSPVAAEERERTAGTLDWLAAQTGGVSVPAGSALTPGLERMAGELDAYYALTFQPAVTDGRFHPIELKTRRAGITVRSRPGYWAPLSTEVREWLARGTAPAAARTRSPRRSVLVDSWFGLTVVDGSPRMVVSWEPAARLPPSAARRALPSRVELTARAADGTTLFEGAVARTGNFGATPATEVADAARFAAPPGRIELDMRILAADGSLLDTDVRDIVVPDPAAARAPLILPPHVVRARTMREFRAVVDDRDAAPTGARVFSRGDRLLIRVPVTGGDRAAVQINARVLNRMGQPMRALDRSPLDDGMVQFDLALSWLPPGEYFVEVTARSGPTGQTMERVALRVTS